jgi:hypothetical protein
MRLAGITAALALAFGLVSAPAPGVLIDSGDGTGNTTAPVPDPGFYNVGDRGGLSAVYLGGRFAITAHHAGPGNVALAGVTYTYVPGTAVQLDNGDGTYADLTMFQIYPAPPLTALTIASSSPPVGAALILSGNGRNRGAATTFDPNGPDPPDPVSGYQWGPGQSLRWGTNTVADELLIDLVDDTRTMALETVFDAGGSAHEAQGVVGDSGGAAFAWNGSQWQLAGILFAVGAAYADQPPETSLYGNLTFSADLATYRSQILGVMALPEPVGGLWPAGALAVLLARRRARNHRFTFSSTRS